MNGGSGMSKTAHRHELVIYGTVRDYEDLPEGIDSHDVWASLMATVLPAMEAAAERAITAWLAAHPDQMADRPGII